MYRKRIHKDFTCLSEFYSMHSMVIFNQIKQWQHLGFIIHFYLYFALIITSLLTTNLLASKIHSYTYSNKYRNNNFSLHLKYAICKCIIGNFVYVRHILRIQAHIYFYRNQQSLFDSNMMSVYVRNRVPFKVVRLLFTYPL